MLDRYYELRGWDKNGLPTRETVEHYGLEDIINEEDFYK